MPKLLYIGQAPAPGTGSPTILLRHLRRFSASGWKIQLLPNWGDKVEHCLKEGWSVLELPQRRWWWPPLGIQTEWRRQVMVRLWAEDLKRRLTDRPDAILTYLAWHTDLFAEIACKLGEITGIPVNCIVHDDAVAFSKDPGTAALLRRRQARILRRNKHNWFVSKELAADMAPVGADRSLLIPIPEALSPSDCSQPDEATLQTRAQKPLRVYFAGYLWPEQADLLEDLVPSLRAAGAELHLQGPETDGVKRLVSKGLAQQTPMFASNQEALANLRLNASALLVSYTRNSAVLPWVRTSIPSKLIEYARLGLPILLVAPGDTAIMTWARQHQAPDAAEPLDKDFICKWVSELRDPAELAKRSNRWQTLAGDEWNPDLIHRTLEKNLF